MSRLRPATDSPDPWTKPGSNRPLPALLCHASSCPWKLHAWTPLWPYWGMNNFYHYSLFLKVILISHKPGPCGIFSLLWWVNAILLCGVHHMLRCGGLSAYSFFCAPPTGRWTGDRPRVHPSPSRRSPYWQERTAYQAAKPFCWSVY